MVNNYYTVRVAVNVPCPSGIICESVIIKTVMVNEQSAVSSTH